MYAGNWRSLGELNPCFRRERPASWSTRRRERSVAADYTCCSGQQKANGDGVELSDREMHISLCGTYGGSSR